MAIVTTIFGGGINGLVLCEYTYDDGTLLIESIILVNNDSIAHTITGEAYDRTTLALLVQETARVNPNSTRTFDISGTNLHMVSLTGKGGVAYLAPPVILAVGVS